MITDDNRLVLDYSNGCCSIHNMELISYPDGYKYCPKCNLEEYYKEKSEDNLALSKLVKSILSSQSYSVGYDGENFIIIDHQINEIYTGFKTYVGVYEKALLLSYTRMIF